MAVATMEWLKRKQNWNPLARKIRPLDKGWGEEWAEQMAVRYAERYGPCAFHLI